jgi:hypothetical protein
MQMLKRMNHTLKLRSLGRAWIGIGALAGTMLFGPTGCHQPKNTPKSRVAGMVYVLPGIEGKGPLNIGIANGLRDGGVDYAIEIFDWGGSMGVMSWFENLTDDARNDQKARELARKITKYKRTYPSSPVHLVAHSGGAGIALRAVELLPKRCAVDTVILLAGAVSPKYDLRRALDKTTRGIWNYHSPADVGFLGVGTTLLGGTDREHGPAAGVKGFVVTKDIYRSAGDLAKVQAKLTQVEYSVAMAKKGHLGDHFGWANSRWVAAYLSPVVMNEVNVNEEPEPEEAVAAEQQVSNEDQPADKGKTESSP